MGARRLALADPATALLLATLITPCLASESTSSESTSSESTADRREEVYSRYLEFSELIRGGSVEPRWLGEGDRFVFESARDGVTYRVDPQVGTVEAVEPLPVEAPAEPPPVIRPGNWDGAPPVSELPSPDGLFLATEKDDDLRLRWSVDGRVAPLVGGGEPGFAWRLTDFDHWTEARWSPDGLFLAAFKEDVRGMARLPIVHWLKTTEEVTWQPFVKAGGEMPRLELHLVDRLAGASRLVATAENQLFHIIDWLPDGSELWFLRMRRDFRELEVLAADPRTGAVRTVHVERSPTFIKVMGIEPSWDESVNLLPSRRQFLWQSEQSGVNRLELRDFDGAPVRVLTPGTWPVIRVVGVDETAGWVYFTGHDDTARPYDTHLYRVALDGSGLRRLTEASGHHEIELSPTKSFFLDLHSTVTRPPRTELRRADGELVRVLEEADVSALDELGWVPPEPFVALAADGATELHGVLVKPWDFDPAKRYPVLEWIYAGPFRVHHPRTFDDRRILLARALAQLGYVVFTVDGRGTPERGKAFQDVVHRRFGSFEIADHVAALRRVAATRPWMDLDRVGIYGNSWGGYMTLRALLTAPEIYRVGVATNPLADLWDHGAIGLEGYMDLPRDNLEGYRAGSNLEAVSHLQGNLLLVHATSDRNATFSGTMKIVHALIEADKPFDLLVVPESGHILQGHDREYWRNAVRRFLGEHLPPGGRQEMGREESLQEDSAGSPEGQNRMHGGGGGN